MPQWFCWYRRSGLLGHRRTQCGSWKVGSSRGKPSTTSRPSISVRKAGAAVGRLVHAAAGHREVQVRRVARVDDDRVHLRAVGRAVLHRAHPLRYCGSSLMDENGAQVTPPSSERNRPLRRGARVPDAGLARRGRASARTCGRRTRPLPSAALAKAGGRAASFQVCPRSVERNTVGPRCPVLAAASRVRPSRGSSTRWWMM
jgi:hypothetical protein